MCPNIRAAASDPTSPVACFARLQLQSRSNTILIGSRHPAVSPPPLARPPSETMSDRITSFRRQACKAATLIDDIEPAQSKVGAHMNASEKSWIVLAASAIVRAIFGRSETPNLLSRSSRTLPTNERREPPMGRQRQGPPLNGKPCGAGRHAYGKPRRNTEPKVTVGWHSDRPHNNYRHNGRNEDGAPKGHPRARAQRAREAC